MKTVIAEYIWLDGNERVAQIRSKSRICAVPEDPTPADFPGWSFDGSSTNQAMGEDSDCLLEPVCVVRDPLKQGGDYLVLCEVLDSEGNIHPSNTRSQLRSVLTKVGAQMDPWLGFEQEYTLFKRNIPLGWPEHGFPAPQGPYFCGVGTEQIFGRELAVKHMQLCLKAGIMIYGINAEVMPGQWEFQTGYRGIEGESADALRIADHTWIGRWLLHRLSEDFGVHVSFANKPAKGDWNGAGMHTNFSTAPMRDPKTGSDTIKVCLERLEKKHKEHIAVYGYGLEERLTGLHETSSIDEFSAGDANRSCSIRIPRMVAQKGYGYLEDRRPGANADPYQVAAKLIATICDVEVEDLRLVS